ncbi:tyrosine-type recombinase/integrase [Streptomyces antibioticus]|uniref:tyrosine-type recombinase/integrase n=1 Tax=Streptomyces antibioticus TaxID=1890 RepID=UPI0036FEFDE2
MKGLHCIGQEARISLVGRVELCQAASSAAPPRSSGEPLDRGQCPASLKAIVKKVGLKPEWTPRELQHSFLSLLSGHGIPLERIALLIGHSSQATAEAVRRKQLRPVTTQGVEAMDDIVAEGQEGEDTEGEEEGDAVA